MEAEGEHPPHSRGLLPSQGSGHTAEALQVERQQERGGGVGGGRLPAVLRPSLHGAGRPAPGQALSRAVSEVWRLPWSSLVPGLRGACG